MFLDAIITVMARIVNSRSVLNEQMFGVTAQKSPKNPGFSERCGFASSGDNLCFSENQRFSIIGWTFETPSPSGRTL
jgi:hypothetical protein